MNPDEVEVVIRRVDEAEIDEMWSFVGKKKEQRWLWHALDHRSGKVLAYVMGTRQDEVFLRNCQNWLLKLRPMRALQGVFPPISLSRRNEAVQLLYSP